ncbi:MAG: MBL fold metallo-hydrolase [Clostridiales bacterium]|nr:MBL fold metallo-hydrolase [Clostridiales bacterium]
MAKLFYQGHGSYRITADDGRVIYVDPYAGADTIPLHKLLHPCQDPQKDKSGGYDLPADFILVTHQHGDHNQIQLVTQKPGCRVITNAEALAGGKHNSFDLGGGLTVEAVEAKNLNHSPEKCVGFIITVDSVKIYASGDTSTTEQMKSFAARELDYALFPLDGVFNMGLKEGAECARIVGAKHNIPIHLKPGALYDRKKADKWDAPNKLIVEPGDEIELCKTP